MNRGTSFRFILLVFAAWFIFAPSAVYGKRMAEDGWGGYNSAGGGQVAIDVPIGPAPPVPSPPPPALPPVSPTPPRDSNVTNNQSNNAEKKSERYVPTFIEAWLALSANSFVSDDMIILEGMIAFDQVMTIHWDLLTPDRLDLKPFRVLNVSIGPERPFGQSDKIFADYRMVRISLLPPDNAKMGAQSIPAFRISYSYQEGERTVKKELRIGPWQIKRVPILVKTSLSSDVIHLGEVLRFSIEIRRDDDIKVLNQFLAVLKDEEASESEKAEIRRWLKALEVRKEPAFNLDQPDMKPMKVLKKSVREVSRSKSRVMVYAYELAYYQEARKIIELPSVKLWYVGSRRDGIYQEHQSVEARRSSVGIGSRLTGKDRWLAGPTGPAYKNFSAFDSALGYMSLAAGVFMVGGGAFLLFGLKKRVAAKKELKSKPISFREASKSFVTFIKPIRFGEGILGLRGVQLFRKHLFEVVGAVIGLSREEVAAKTADELVVMLESRYGRAYIGPVERILDFADRALSLAEIAELNHEGVPLDRVLLEEAMPYLTKESTWYALLFV